MTLKEKLNKGYFKRNPDEYYILGSGDAIDIVVSPEYPELNQKKTRCFVRYCVYCYPWDQLS